MSCRAAFPDFSSYLPKENGSMNGGTNDVHKSGQETKLEGLAVTDDWD